ncbi:daunorubicin resistance protein DrrA family ABC transporter ATP-binding protein [soil metagenome]
MSEELAIEAVGLRKRYGDTQALDGVDLGIAPGKVLGVLGPNGAGKTTSVRVLTTLLKPDSCAARVGGIDVLAHPDLVRTRIGVTGQSATLDELLSGRQNLAMVGELSRLGRAGAKARATELLHRFDLTDAADRMVKGYSGGMRRRLDLAASLVTSPSVLFLDEPTTGLDPTSRMRMWTIIRELVAEGTTVLLTTQYLDEADELAEQRVVIYHGRVIAEGTSMELKQQVGGERLHLTFSSAGDAALGVVAPFASGPVDLSADGRELTAHVDHRAGLITDVVRALDAVGIVVDDVELRRPSLDDVFFQLTGEPASSADATDPTDPSSTEAFNPEGVLA